MSWAAKRTRLERSGAVPSRPSISARRRSRVRCGADTLCIGMLPDEPRRQPVARSPAWLRQGASQPRFPAILRLHHANPQTPTPQRSSVAPGHVGGGPGLVDEDQPLGIEIQLALEPRLAPLSDVGPVLLFRVSGLFLRVIWCRRQKRQSALTLTCAAFSAKRAFNSGRVMSGPS